MRRLSLLFLAMAGLWVAGSGIARGGDGCCDRCGCIAKCCKICRLERVEEEIEITCWGCQCEDFCVPCRSCLKCTHCGVACAPGGCCDGPVADGDSDVCTCAKSFIWREWSPSGAKVFTKKKLMKATYTKKVPSFKWVVEEVCSACAAGIGHCDDCDGCPPEANAQPTTNGIAPAPSPSDLPPVDEQTSATGRPIEMARRLSNSTSSRRPEQR